MVLVDEVDAITGDGAGGCWEMVDGEGRLRLLSGSERKRRWRMVMSAKDDMYEEE